MRRIVKFLIRIYQYAVSPFLPPSCRFYPTCSAYAIEAVEQHGSVRGLWLGLRRLLRCHPWHPGGYDPVPPPKAAPLQSHHAPPDHAHCDHTESAGSGARGSYTLNG
ncbi:MAG: membrane protein insertion efficiency factor YidD [Gammaproteobacteria bacterium]|nr:membrane protein insertion efficiency factor YidD [Gammaproteobacteria bacterium]NNJ84160.1 membrane protein insertion efficiency factor YidD [Gammaproteobacteria bacterium]